jgi:hypothetical protein
MTDITFDRAFWVIHPLDDAPEAKLYHPDLGRIRIAGPVRACLFVLRAYLALMVLLVAYHALGLAGFL